MTHDTSDVTLMLPDGHREGGSTTTPFDMAALNDLDRFHLLIDVIDRVPTLGYGRALEAADARQAH